MTKVVVVATEVVAGERVVELGHLPRGRRADKDPCSQKLGERVGEGTGPIKRTRQL